MPAEHHTTLTPDTPVRYLKGVGPKTAERFEKLGIVQHGHGDHRTRLLIYVYVHFTIAHPSAQYGQHTKFPFLSSLRRHSDLSRTQQKNSGSSRKSQE